jgi:hypothetical protein
MPSGKEVRLENVFHNIMLATLLRIAGICHLQCKSKMVSWAHLPPVSFTFWTTMQVKLPGKQISQLSGTLDSVVILSE